MILRGACVALALAMTARAGELETAHRVARAGIVEKLEEHVLPEWGFTSQSGFILIDLTLPIRPDPVYGRSLRPTSS